MLPMAANLHKNENSMCFSAQSDNERGRFKIKVTRAVGGGGGVEPCRPPMINVGPETAFRHDHCKHIQKSKHLLGSGVS